MLDIQFILVISLLILLWAVAITYIRNVGPGKVFRTVLCPEKKQRASLVVLFKEPIWGRLEATDVVSCSLLEKGPVSCGKQCLAKL